VIHTERLRAEHPDHVWAIDFEFDETADARRLKLANIVDEHTREALAMRVGRSCTADDLVIEPGSPWENPYIESFNGRVRDELLNLEEFTSLTVAQVVVEAWRIEYNTYPPHSALDGLTPASTRPPGPAPPNPHSHSEWTTNRGPVTAKAELHYSLV
jgi:putative transposase